MKKLLLLFLVSLYFISLQAAEVQLQITSSWQGGYCANVVITPTTNINSWNISLNFSGTLSSSWGGTYTVNAQTGKLTIVSLDYNSVIASGSSITIGFCASSNTPATFDSANLNQPGGITSVITSAFIGNSNNLYMAPPYNKLGIGTNTPAELLQLGDRFVFHNGGTKILGFNFKYDNILGDVRQVSNVGFSQLRFENDGSFHINTAPAGPTGSSVNVKGIFVMDENGKVGIGTSTPTANLHTTGTLRFQGIEEAANRILTSDGSGNATWKEPIWSLNGVTATYYIPDDQNNSQKVLDLGKGKRHLFIKPQLGSSDITTITQTDDFGIFWSDGIHPRFGTNVNAGLVIAPHSTSLTNSGIRIDSYGNVGIGTDLMSNTLTLSDGSTDSYKLSVNGRIRAKEIRVEANWADYVFESNYKLLPLSELENYIKNHGHLPNINSTSDITENGLSVGEMQTKQMEKIEELTLYIIQQQKEIEELKKELKSIKK